MVKKKIWITFQKEGIHCYPAAATDPKLKDVAFLSHPHRHIFHFKVYLEVFHDDRDVEFIMFKRDVQDYLKQMYYSPETRTHEFGPKSCEMLAREILNQFNCLVVKVWEDLENGAIVEA